MSTEAAAKPKIEWGPPVLLAGGVAVFLFGARGFYLRGHFGASDALACALALVPAGLFLLLSGYVFQHARFVIVIPIIVAVVPIRAYPAFGVALGLALAGTVASSLLSDWKDRRRPAPHVPPASPHEGQL